VSARSRTGMARQRREVVAGNTVPRYTSEI
jgi:hypothetical protein